jgi:restriction endonuclease S subunit
VLKRLKYAVIINPETLPEETDPDYVLRYVDIGSVDASGTILRAEEMKFRDAPSRARRRVRHGDVIVSTVRTYLRAIALIEHPPANLVVSTGFAVLRPGPGIEPAFLWRLVQSPQFVALVMAHSEGVGYPAISPAHLANLPIWLPPLAEQRAIIAHLEGETARINALIARKEQLIALLQEWRAALINRTVTRGLDSAAPIAECHPAHECHPEHHPCHPERSVGSAHSHCRPERSPVILSAAKDPAQAERCASAVRLLPRWGTDARLLRAAGSFASAQDDMGGQDDVFQQDDISEGKIPARWRRTALKRCLISLRDGTHGTFARVSDGVPLLSAKNVHDGRLIITDQESRIAYEDFARLDSSGYLQPGDLLLTIVGSIGRVATFDHAGPLAFQRSVAMLRFRPEHDVHYFYYLAQSSCFQSLLASYTRQSAQGGVYLGDVARLPVVVPPLAEQHAIAAYLDCQTARIDALTARIREGIEKLREYSAALLAGAVAGKEQL